MALARVNFAVRRLAMRESRIEGVSVFCEARRRGRRLWQVRRVFS